MTSITPLLEQTYDWCQQQLPKQGILSATLLGISASVASIPFKALAARYYCQNKPIEQEVDKKFTRDLVSNKLQILCRNSFQICLASPLIEELLFRHLLQRNFLPLICKNGEDRELSVKEKTFCVLTSSALFAAAHYEKTAGLHSNRALLAYTFIGGLVYGSLAEITDSIYSSTVAHSTNNCISMARTYCALKKR